MAPSSFAAPLLQALSASSAVGADDRSKSKEVCGP